MPVVELGYDKEKHRFKGIAFPVIAFTAGIVLFFVMQLVTGVAYMIFFSYLMVVVAIIALVHDQWIVNSLLAPTSILFIVILATDIIDGLWINAAIHGVTAVSAIITTTRKNTSFIVMVLASVFYAAYLFTVNYWAGIYTCGAWFCEPAIEAVTMFGTGFGTAIIVLSTNLRYQKKGGKIDCEGGICPL
jgi:hypothetical protein